MNIQYFSHQIFTLRPNKRAKRFIDKDNAQIVFHCTTSSEDIDGPAESGTLCDIL